MDKQIATAVKNLKTELGESYQAFATRCGLSIASAVRYADGSRRPSPQALARFLVAAEQANRPDLAAVFQAAAQSLIGGLAFSDIGSARIHLLKARRHLADGNTEGAREEIRAADRILAGVDAFGQDDES
ncbi:MAG: hypothetical protein KJZ78_18620 [Bryobacteraceae bacterium]|nr:hypothetical protein [Bryobacteraceae bacterium]